MSKIRLMLGIPAILISTSAAGQVSPRIETFTYHDRADLWVLGQKSSVTVNGVQESATGFDERAQPNQLISFGRVKNIIIYAADGTLASVADGSSNITNLQDWYRGVPRRILFADGSAISAEVNDRGWISSSTDESGYLISYQHDAMGRLMLISPAPDIDISYNSTLFTLARSDNPDSGVPAGHWQHTETTGSFIKTTFLDALWRPVLISEYDNSDRPATQRYTRRVFDFDGNVIFESYPDQSYSSETGTWIEFDNLNRVTSTARDSEIGLLVDTRDYIEGFRTLETKASGNQTLTSYQIWDQPVYDRPLRIETSLNTSDHAFVDIVRDISGKPVSVSQGDIAGQKQVTRSYVYNVHQDLCKVIEPETGASVFNHDGAGNVAWSSRGHLDLLDQASCNYDEAYAGGRRVDNTYDSRNRRIATRYPNNIGNVDVLYYPSGNVEQTIVDNGGDGLVTTVYVYNSRGLLTGEAMGSGDVAWALGYSYDENANLGLVRHSPSGLDIELAPNALGQPTRAGSFATDAKYHPSGDIESFIYGNGIQHHTYENARGLRQRSVDSLAGSVILDETYSYDNSGNIISIADGSDGARGSRVMSYDSRNRLIAAESPMFGAAVYSYDGLDNLLSASVSGGTQSRQLGYVYDLSNKVTSISGVNGSPNTEISYDPQGNISAKGSVQFDFDFANLLRSSSGSNYKYDGNNRRVQIVTTQGSSYSMYGFDGVLRYDRNQASGLSTDYIYLGDRLVARVETPNSLVAPTISISELNANGSYFLSWTSVNGSINYDLASEYNGGDWVSSYLGAELSSSFSDQSAGTHSYRVRACGNSCSAWSDHVSILVDGNSVPEPDLNPPVLEASAVTATGSYVISWQGPARSAFFELSEKISKQDWEAIYAGTNATMSFGNRPRGVYSYRARTCSSTTCGHWSEEKHVPVLINQSPITPK